MFVVNRRRSGVDCKRILCESKMSPCCFFTAYTYCICSYALQTEYEPGATNLFQHPRQCYKELYDQCMAKKKPWTRDFFFCLMSVLETLQLFDKALIGFLLEIHFKFTLNAFVTVKHVCVIKIEIAKFIKEIAISFFIHIAQPYHKVCLHWTRQSYCYKSFEFLCQYVINRARHQLERGFKPGLEREFVAPRMHPVYTDSITDCGCRQGKSHADAMVVICLFSMLIYSPIKSPQSLILFLQID